MKRLVILLVLLLSSNSFAYDKWTTTDTVLQSVYVALHTTDWVQSRWIAKHGYIETPFARTNPDGSAVFGRSYVEHKEGNVLLGEHPHKDKVDIYFASTLILHTLVSYLLPSNYRHIWQGVTIGMEGTAIGHNVRAGVKMKF